MKKQKTKKPNSKDDQIEPIIMRNVWVVYNINGDVIGVADSLNNALSIYENRYYDFHGCTDDKIVRFPLNKMVYA